MQILITQKNYHLYSSIMNEVYEFRHRFFVDHMKWEALRKPDGLEIDEFDYPECVHIVGFMNGSISSYSRLLPTQKPHLLSHIYPEMLGGTTEPVGESIWEWTRCAVDPKLREGRKGADPATTSMYLGVTEACLLLGIEALHVQTHPMLLTRMIELGWDCRPLSLPSEYDGKTVVPIFAKVSEQTLSTSRNLFGFHETVLRYNLHKRIEANVTGVMTDERTQQ